MVNNNIKKMAVTVMGRTMNLEVLKVPRGALRVLQFGFAMLAFSFCAGFSSSLEFKITYITDSNNSDQTLDVNVGTSYSYPFALDHIKGVKIAADIPKLPAESTMVYFPGDFSSEAKFFVFVGVVCWLYCAVSLLVYTFMSDEYDDGSKNYPIYDFAIAAVFAFFWLAASSTWAHGLNGLKSSGDPDNWIFSDTANSLAPMCRKNKEDYSNVNIKSCESVFAGNFAGANISVLIGFLNLFFWTCNLWFLYKETRWFAAKQGNLQNVESPVEPN